MARPPAGSAGGQRKSAGRPTASGHASSNWICQAAKHLQFSKPRAGRKGFVNFHYKVILNCVSNIFAYADE
jgi:hypothetical protein